MATLDPNSYQYEFVDIIEEDDKYYKQTSTSKAIYGDTDTELLKLTHQQNQELFPTALKDHQPDTLLKQLKQKKTGQNINFSNDFFWNEQYQKVLDTPTTNPEAGKRKRTQLEHLSARFSSAAREVVVQIIEDISVPVKDKQYKPLDVGGIAGGTKFGTKDMFFKFATDDQKLYNGDEFSAKAAFAELRALNALISVGIPHLHFPLMSIITYHGYSVICVSKLPINKSTLVYGSCDAGNTIYDSTEVHNLMKQLCAQLNLKGHFVIERSTNKPKYIFGPVDIEGHLGFDGRLYIIDTARLLPPTARIPKTPGCHLYKMFRPEFLQTFESPISSDIFTRWGKIDSEINDDEGIKATHHLLSKAVPELAKSLPEIENLAGNLKSIMHSRGINLRFLGLLFESCESNYQMEILLEMVTRQFKHILFRRMRSIMSQTSDPQLYLQIAADCFDCLVNTHSAALKFWKILQRNLLSTFFQHHLLLNSSQHKAFIAKSLEISQEEIRNPAKMYELEYQDDETESTTHVTVETAQPSDQSYEYAQYSEEPLTTHIQSAKPQKPYHPVPVGPKTYDDPLGKRLVENREDQAYEESSTGSNQQTESKDPSGYDLYKDEQSEQTQKKSKHN